MKNMKLTKFAKTKSVDISDEDKAFRLAYCLIGQKKTLVLHPPLGVTHYPVISWETVW